MTTKRRPNNKPQQQNSDSLTALQQSNQERVNKLAAEGIQLNPNGITDLRLRILSDMLLTPEQQRASEETFQRELEELLVQAEQAVAKAKLTAHLTVPGQ